MGPDKILTKKMVKDVGILTKKDRMPETTSHGGDKYVPQPVLNVLRSAFFGGNLLAPGTFLISERNFGVVLMCFLASPCKTLQNHAEILQKTCLDPKRSIFAKRCKFGPQEGKSLLVGVGFPF